MPFTLPFPFYLPHHTLPKQGQRQRRTPVLGPQVERRGAPKPLVTVSVYQGWSCPHPLCFSRTQPPFNPSSLGPPASLPLPLALSAAAHFVTHSFVPHPTPVCSKHTQRLLFQQLFPSPTAPNAAFPHCCGSSLLQLWSSVPQPPGLVPVHTKVFEAMFDPVV